MDRSPSATGSFVLVFERSNFAGVTLANIKLNISMACESRSETPFIRWTKPLRCLPSALNFLG